jgi:uncharacterized protein (TIGR03118 family)
MKRFKQVLLFSTLVAAAACHKMVIDKNDLRDFEQVNLVANKAMYGPKLVDTTLQNAWGLTWAPSGIAWVNANGTGLSELYTGEGAIVRAPVRIPSPADTMGGTPSGDVFVGGKGFILADHQGANFLFVGEDGVLSGWNGAAGNNALRIKDNSAHAIYKGVTVAMNGGGNFVYAANFKTGKIDVWDTAFHAVSLPFHDPGIPGGFAPFNIQAVGSWLFVTYAKQKPNSGDEADGPGLGFVDIFNPDGSFVKRFASEGKLNAPWGVTMTPAGFLEEKNVNKGDGKNGAGGVNFLGDSADVAAPVILVGNFGDGHINVFTQEGKFAGQLMSKDKDIVIDGLWALQFAPTTATTIDPMRLYFTAGPNGENDGIFGYLIKQ